MILSKLYILIASFFRSIIKIYDDSCLCHIIEKICNYFSGKCKESFFVNTLASKNSFREALQKSRFFGIICVPFNILKKFYYTNEEKINTAKEKSTLLNFFRSARFLPAKDLGLMLFCLGLGMLLSAVLFHKIYLLNILAGALVMISGLVFVLCKASVNNIFKSSIVFNSIQKLLFEDYRAKDDDTIYNMPYSKTVCLSIFVISFALGYISVYAPLLALIGCIAVFAILLNPILGVYAIALGTALLPTMANVAIVALTMFSYLIHLAFDKETCFKPSCFSVAILAFLLFVGLGAVISVEPMSSILVFGIYFVFTIAFILVTNIIKTQKQWYTTIILFVLSSFIVSVYGIIQNFTLDGTTQSWVDSNMFSEISTRVYSTLSNPNVLGQFFILTIPVILSYILYRIRSSLSTKKTAVYFIFMLSVMTCLIFTWSRSAWVGVMLAVVLILCIYDKRWIALCVAAVFVMPLILPESILARLTSIGNTNDSSTSYRISVWLGSIKMIQDYPLCGIGLGSDAFLKAYGNYALSGADFALHAHNFYLQWIADIGVWGLIIFAYIILTAYGLIASVKSKSSLMKFVSVGLGCAILGYLFQGMAETLWYNYKMVLIFWFYMAIIQTASDIDEVSGGGISD